MIPHKLFVVCGHDPAENSTFFLVALFFHKILKQPYRVPFRKLHEILKKKSRPKDVIYQPRFIPDFSTHDLPNAEMKCKFSKWGK